MHIMQIIIVVTVPAESRAIGGREKDVRSKSKRK